MLKYNSLFDSFSILCCGAIAVALTVSVVAAAVAPATIIVIITWKYRIPHIKERISIDKWVDSKHLFSILHSFFLCHQYFEYFNWFIVNWKWKFMIVPNKNRYIYLRSSKPWSFVFLFLLSNVHSMHSFWKTNHLYHAVHVYFVTCCFIFHSVRMFSDSDSLILSHFRPLSIWIIMVVVSIDRINKSQLFRRFGVREFWYFRICFQFSKWEWEWK